MPSSAVGFNVSVDGLLVVASAGFLGCAVTVVAGAGVTVGLDDATGVMAAGLGAGGAADDDEGVVVAGTGGVLVVGLAAAEAAGAPKDEDVPNGDDGATAGDLAPGTVFFANEPKPPDPRVDVDPNALVAGGVAAAGVFTVDVEPNKDGDAVVVVVEVVALLPNKVEGIVVEGDFAPGTVFFASEPKPPLPNVLVDPKADSVLVAGLGASVFFSSFVVNEPNERDATSASVFEVVVVAGAGVGAGAPEALAVEVKNGEAVLLAEPKLDEEPKEDVVA